MNAGSVRKARTARTGPVRVAGLAGLAGAVFQGLASETSPRVGEPAALRDAFVAAILHATFHLFLEARSATAEILSEAHHDALGAISHHAVETRRATDLFERARAVLRGAWSDAAPALEELGASYEGLVGLELTASGGTLAVIEGSARRLAGAHYTSLALASKVVALALAPLLPPSARVEDVLALTVCDPAMGSGVFLLAACRHLASRLVELGEAPASARRTVVERCLYGVDRDAFAVLAARMTLQLEALGPLDVRDAAAPSASSVLGMRLRHADALLGPAPGAEVELILPRAAPPLAWARAFPEVFARQGFGAIVGNPPWVSYAGRAAQPLDPATRAHFEATSPAFHGYRNLQAIFVHRAATLLRPGGRLGLVLPTSMSDLQGYEPSRRAHDALCVCDDALPDLASGGFEGVFQPCMALLSTRRRSIEAVERSAPWPLERNDLDPEAARILQHLERLPRLPEHLFGERGFQTARADVAELSPEPTGTRIHPLRVGGDVAPARRRAPSLFCDPASFGRRFRAPAAWAEVRLLLRQTARYPMAAFADGAAFRNSILAGFADEHYSPGLLLAYLNSSPVRFFHFMRHRDARQGMPQLKIGHLRALPAPPRSVALGRIRVWGDEVGARNLGIDLREQATLDELVGEALGLDVGARARIDAWATSLRR